MTSPKPSSLHDEQIKVSASMKSAAEILKTSKPYFESAVKSLSEPGSAKMIEVPPALLRDLVLLTAAEVKRSEALFNVKMLGTEGAVHDAGNSDWNPFRRIDFEFD